jgi:hypothetical protein
MVTIGTSNLTLTLSALSLKAADHILQDLKRDGNLTLEDKPMTTGELDKKTYGRIIEDHFRAFGTPGWLRLARVQWHET